jgi:hypothetical protein
MHDSYDQAGIASVIFWLLFQLITKYMIMNIFIAVIFDNFMEVKAEDENDIFEIKKKDIFAFVDTWAKLCPYG